MGKYDIIGQLEHVIKAFGDVVAVSDTSFAIEKGTIMGFLGPNGAGKTTSIQLLLGLIKPQFGKVSLFGVDPFTNSRVKKLVGYISEEGAYYNWITALDFLESLARFNMSRELAKRRSREVLEEVELSEVADKQIRQFSKGMRQRMKIAQALIHRPALVLADEPFNGLDPVIRKNMFDLFRKYNEEYNTTFFISSHILFEVEKLTDKIILMYKGRSIAQGSPKRIREMIQDQPHSIQITTKNPREMASLLIENGNNKIVSSVQFEKNQWSGKDNQLIISTNAPNEFYKLFNQLVIDHKLAINEFKATDEGLETLFKSLTVG